MKQLQVVSALVTLLGVIGTFASVSTVANETWRVILTACCLLITVSGGYLYVSALVDISSLWGTLTTAKQLGVKRIHPNGIAPSDAIRRAFSKAKSLRIMAVSAQALIKTLKDEIVQALAENSAHVRVLLAEPNQAFVEDVEAGESETRVGQISPEIIQVEKLLQEYTREARERAGPNRVLGKVQLGFFRTQLGSSIILCDNTWGWLTLRLAPKRAVQTASLELAYIEKGLLVDCANHFEKAWEITSSRGKVRDIS